MSSPSSSTTSSSAAGGVVSSTYEAHMARQSAARQPDPIHWDDRSSFRDQPYRQLHHQRGVIGAFNVRLLEGSDLRRSYWSPLALGPVKHFGLSTAHGAVSAYCTLRLSFQDAYRRNNDRYDEKGGNHNIRDISSPGAALSPGMADRKPEAKRSGSSIGDQPAQVSPLVHKDNNPVWENCSFDFTLAKGAMPADGMRVVLKVRVDEDATALEQFVPGVPAGGDERLLGRGCVDVTDLLLGETGSGQALPGVKDVWVPISLHQSSEHNNDNNLAVASNRNEPQQKYDKNDPLAPPPAEVSKFSVGDSEDSPVTGRIRLLVSYQPTGLEPQERDVVALEAFARRNGAASTCNPLLQPLQPLTVVNRRGSYLLCEHTTPADRRKACVRLHRNAVFVIERQTLVDAAHNLALLPADVLLSTPVGAATANALGPVVAAGRELFMPALLSFKLLWLAVRTTTLAGISGAGALSRTMWEEGSQSLSSDNNSRPQQSSQDARVAAAQFVQL